MLVGTFVGMIFGNLASWMILRVFITITGGAASELMKQHGPIIVLTLSVLSFGVAGSLGAWIFASFSLAGELPWSKAKKPNKS